MTRINFVAKIATVNNIPTKTADSLLKSITQAITDVIASGDSIRFTNFGNFSTSKSPARRGVSPASGKRIDIAACIKPKFKVSKKLKLAVNS